MADIELLSPKDFEWFCKFFFDNSGYESVAVTQKHGERQADGGIDITMRKSGEKIYVQCKRWAFGFGAENVLPVRVIRELGGCMLRDDVRKGIVITTLKIDELGKREAALMNIETMGHEEISAQMKFVTPTFNQEKRIGFFRKLLDVLYRAIRIIVSFFVFLVIVSIIITLIYNFTR